MSSGMDKNNEDTGPGSGWAGGASNSNTTVNPYPPPVGGTAPFGFGETPQPGQPQEMFPSQPQQQQGPVVGIVAPPPPVAMGEPEGGSSSGDDFHRDEEREEIIVPPIADPRGALAWFPSMIENRIRHPRYYCCGTVERPVGSVLPMQWFEGGDGWAAKYFYTPQPMDLRQRISGVHRCRMGEYQHPGSGACDHQVNEEAICDNALCGKCCALWAPKGNTASEMKRHLREFHNIQPPEKQPWATRLCDNDGCLDVLCCCPCQASRQMMAASGHEDYCSKGWCMFFALGGPHCGRWNVASPAMCVALPVCCPVPFLLGPYMARTHITRLSNINETEIETCINGCMFPCCSLAQTYRQFVVDGVDPGRTCTCCDDDDHNDPSYHPHHHHHHSEVIYFGGGSTMHMNTGTHNQHQEQAVAPSGGGGGPEGGSGPAETGGTGRRGSTEMGEPEGNCCDGCGDCCSDCHHSCHTRCDGCFHSIDSCCDRCDCPVNADHPLANICQGCEEISCCDADCFADCDFWPSFCECLGNGAECFCEVLGGACEGLSGCNC